jgi:hypothetical protein
MQRYGDAEQRSIRAKGANIIQGIFETHSEALRDYAEDRQFKLLTFVIFKR